MAHKLLEENVKEKKHRKSVLARINGRFGVSVSVGSKEFFLGLMVGNVVEEEVLKKRYIKTQKGTARVFRYDPLA